VEELSVSRKRLVTACSQGKGYAHNNELMESVCGGGLEYLHLSPASRKRRRKGNPVPGGITEPPCSWGI
jgi:hypothetical protein